MVHCRNLSVCSLRQMILFVLSLKAQAMRKALNRLPSIAIGCFIARILVSRSCTIGLKMR